MSFPTPASNGQIYSSGGYSYVYNSTLKIWSKVATGVSLANGTVTTSNTASNTATAVSANGVSTGNSTTNTSITANGVSTGNTSITGNTVSTGNSSVNTQITANGLSTGNTLVTGNTVSTGNSSVNTQITANGVSTGNTLITGNTVSTGNSSVNTQITANGISTGNTTVTGNTIATGNSTVNTAITSNGVFTGNSTSNTSINANGVTTGNTVITGNTVSTGNSSVNTQITSNGVSTGNTVVSGNTVSTGNSIVNTSITSNSISTIDTVSNTSITPGTITLGGTTTINATVYTGTANNATYFGGQLPSYYLTTGGISGNVAQLTANNVYYVGDVTAVNVVSNAQLIANLANYTNTASFYLDTLVDVNAGGPTAGQVLTWNSTLGQWINQDVPVLTPAYVTGYYGTYYDQTTQYATAANTEYPIALSNTVIQNGITRSANGIMTIGYTGIYNIQYGIQLTSSDKKDSSVYVWLKINGNSVPQSVTEYQLYGGGGGNGNGSIVATTPFVQQFYAGDTAQIFWATSSNTTQIVQIANTTFIPAAPSVIVTVTPVSTIITAPPGTNTQVQFNDNGYSNATSGFTFNKTTNTISVSNGALFSGAVNATAYTVDGFFTANSTYVYANNGVYFAPKSGTTTNTSEGSVFYDSTNHALNVYTDIGDPQEIGQQTFARVYNATGSTITKGTAVYINGANSNRPTIGKAISNGAIGSSRSIGIVYNDIPGTTEGFVLTGGLMQNVDTRSYTVGQQIYISSSTAGALSNTQPSYPNYSVPIGYALNSALVGSMYITAETATLTLPNTNIYISNGSGPFVSNNFTFDYANSILYIGNSTVNAAIGYINTAGTTTFLKLEANTNSSLDGIIVNYSNQSNASADFAAYDSTGTDGSNFIDMGINGVNWSESFWTINGPSDGYLYTGNTNLSIGTAQAKYINFFTGGTLAANERMRITPTGNVGIGNTAPVHKFSVNGNSYFGSNVIISSAAGIVANGSIGSAGQVLASNGSSVYWTIDQTGGGNVSANSITSNSLSANYITISTGTITVGNSTVNTDIGNNYISVGNSSHYVNVYSNRIYIGNAASSATINSTFYTGTSYNANNATYLNNIASSNYVRTSGNFTLSGNISFDANLVINSSSDIYINAAAGIWANGSFGANGNILTSNGSAVYWSTGLSTSSILANSVAVTTGTLTVGNSTVNTDIGNNYISVGNNIGYVNVYSGYIFLGNTASNATINSTVYTGSSNNTSYLGGVAAANYVNTSGNYTLTGNVAFNANLIIGSAGDLYINAASGIWANGTFGANGNILTSNGSAVYWSAGLTASSLTANAVAVTSGTISVGNSTVNTDIGNNYISVGNNTGYVNVYSGYIFLGNTVSNATINSTIYTGSSNNASYLGGVAAANYVNTSGNYTLSGNVTFNANLVISSTGKLYINAAAGIWANGTFGNANQVLTSNGTAVYWANATVNGAITASNLASDYISIGVGYLTVGNATVNSTVTNTAFRTGNSTVYSTVNSTSIAVNNAIITGYVSANGSNGTSGQVLTTNGTGIYWSTASGGGGASVTVSSTAPVSPSAGNLWWNTETGILYIYYSDGDSSQWVPASPATGAGNGGNVLTLATAQTASGTSVDFTSIPSWVKRITVMFNGVSTSGSSPLLVQIGSGSVTSSGYAAQSGNRAVDQSSTAGFPITVSGGAAYLWGGIITLTLVNPSTYAWACSGNMDAQGAGSSVNFSAGFVTLSGVLDRVRVTTINGTDAYDAGSVNILYEG